MSVKWIGEKPVSNRVTRCAGELKGLVDALNAIDDRAELSIKRLKYPHYYGLKK